MNISAPRVVLAGLRGGSGKTTLSVGLVHSLRERGYRVAPFKKGPDYIDAGWLGRAAGRPCRNLDPFFMEASVIQQSFLRGSVGSDLAVVEGNRGVFDGMDTEGTYSTAELAKLLGAPVVLVIDCTKATRTIGALVLGCREFDPEVGWAGVVLNNVSGARQEALIRSVVEERSGLPVLGAMPRQSVLVGERHMGLTTHLEAEGVGELVGRMGALVASNVDVERIRDLGGKVAPHPLAAAARGEEHVSPGEGAGCRIAVVSDRAFQFYYPENLECLEASGAEVIYVDALSGEPLPTGIHALYVGGGFPEVRSEELHENRTFRNSLKAAAEDGIPMYAECGGLMLLGRTIATGRGTFEMAGVLPVDFTMGRKPVAHGYTVAEVVGENGFFRSGMVLQGHEFHYSSVVRLDADREDFALRMRRGRGVRDGYDGLMRWNVLGAYTHVHALGTPEWCRGLVGAAARQRDK